MKGTKIMNYKEIIECSVSALDKAYPCSDPGTALSKVLERTENMKEKNDGFERRRLVEITPERAEPKKSRRIFTAVAGTAAAVAVIGGSVWGIGYLKENGGLKQKEPVTSTGAGYHETDANAESTADIRNENKPMFQVGSDRDPAEKDAGDSKDIMEAVGDVLEFSDLTATIEQIDYDGYFIRVIYKAESKVNANTGHNGNIAPFMVNFYEYQDTVERHWFSSYEALGNNRFICSAELLLDEGETINNITFEHIPVNVNNGQPEHIGSYSVTGIKQQHIYQTVNNSDMYTVTVSPNGFYIISDREFLTDDMGSEVTDSRFCVIQYKDGTEEEFLLSAHTMGEKIGCADTNEDIDPATIRTIDLVIRKCNVTSTDSNYLTRFMWMNPDQIDIGNIAAVMLNGERIIFEPDASRESNEQGDLSQIAGIYAPGELPYEATGGAYEATGGEETSGDTSGFTLPEALCNGNGFYGPFLDEPIVGDDAWALVKERSGTDLDYILPFDKNLFVFDGAEFFIYGEADCDVTALVGGTVESVGYKGGFGLSVLICDDNGHYWFWYHLSKANVSEGDTVEAGTKIGHTGSSGVADRQRLAMRVG